MLDDNPDAGARDKAADPHDSSVESDQSASDTLTFDDSLVDELAALIDDGKTYAQAELAFQKTRASLAGKNIGAAVGLAVLAIILLHIALLALAVGLVIALQPLVSIWGAIAIVVGVLLLTTGALGYAAASRGKLVAAMFAGAKDANDQEDTVA